MTDELKYDPELPFAVTNSGGAIIGRAVNEFVANQLHKAMDKYGQVIDTTPKPKIPEDANYIFVEDGDQSVFAYRIVGPGGENLWMMAGNGAVTTEELLEYIGDAPVIVMVEREDA